MAISKRLFIYATFVITCAAVALTVTSFATKSWVVGEMRPFDPATQSKNDKINYGLFMGTLVHNLFSNPATVDLYITCISIDCAWSCNRDKDDRRRELEQLIYNGTGTSYKGCAATSREELAHRLHRESDEESTKKESDQKFINSALRICTIIFLSIALIFAVIGAVFSVINSAMNPIELITGIFGLYIWNGVAALCDVIVLILWGTHFAGTLIDNVAYSEVIIGDLISEDLAYLGYSYWCVLGALVLHLCNLVLLGVRQLLINREPPPVDIQVEENNDGMIFLY